MRKKRMMGLRLRGTKNVFLKNTDKQKWLSRKDDTFLVHSKFLPSLSPLPCSDPNLSLAIVKSNSFESSSCL